jgi:hypothetical protein
MTSHSPATATTKQGALSSVEIDKLLSMTIIANLGTTDDDGSIHLLPMWFMRIGNEICIPTSHHTHKYITGMQESDDYDQFIDVRLQRSHIAKIIELLDKERGLWIERRDRMTESRKHLHPAEYEHYMEEVIDHIQFNTEIIELLEDKD